MRTQKLRLFRGTINGILITSEQQFNSVELMAENLEERFGLLFESKKLTSLLVHYYEYEYYKNDLSIQQLENNFKKDLENEISDNLELDKIFTKILKAKSQGKEKVK